MNVKHKKTECLADFQGDEPISVLIELDFADAVVQQSVDQNPRRSHRW